MAERLRNNIRVSVAPGIGIATVSIGAATFPYNAENPESLLHAASEALVVAKFEGRDKVKEAQTGKVEQSGPISWEEIANQARLAVAGDRQARLQSRLAATPEYASWMTKMPDIHHIVKKKEH